MFIHPDDRPREELQHAHEPMARWLEHGWPSGARVSRHPTAGSHHTGTGWTRPRASFAQTFQHLSKGSMHRPHQALLFFSAERGRRNSCVPEKWYLFIPDLIPQPDWDTRGEPSAGKDLAA